MFILFSISSGLEFWSVNHTSIQEKSESIVFNNFKLLGGISNNYQMIYLEQMYARLLYRVDNHCRQYYNELILLQWLLMRKVFTIFVFIYVFFGASK